MQKSRVKYLKIYNTQVRISIVASTDSVNKPNTKLCLVNRTPQFTTGWVSASLQRKIKFFTAFLQTREYVWVPEILTGNSG
jgi:hypothetical protein